MSDLTSNIKVRLATQDDIDQLILLRTFMQQEVNEVKTSDVTESYAQACRVYFQKSILDKSYASAVAEVDGKLIAAAGLVFYEKPPSLPSGSGLVAYLTNVYTLPKYRKMGIGKKMIEQLVFEANKRKAVKINLGTTEDGKGIYKSVGFKPVKFAALELKLGPTT